MSYYRQPPFRSPGATIGFPPLTPMIKIIMIVNASVWAVQLLMGPVLKLYFVEFFPQGRGDFFLLDGLFGVVPERFVHFWVWQPLTYMWLHSENAPFHIILNMLFLWMLGGDLERHWGSRAFLRYYLVCGVGAGLFIAVAGWFYYPFSPTIGASGAVFGLILAFGMIFSERVILFMLIIPMKARIFALVMLFVTFFFTLNPGGGTVSHIAHLGGMVVGFLYLKRAWRIREFIQELRWKMKRRKFKVMPPDDDEWIH